MAPASTLPSSGATTGATPLTIIIRLKARAAERPVSRSAMTARPMTIPADALAPCSRRAVTRTVIVGARAARTLAVTNTAEPASSGPRRP